MRLKSVKRFIVFLMLINLSNEQDILAEKKLPKNPQINWASSISQDTIDACLWWGEGNRISRVYGIHTHPSSIDKSAILAAIEKGTYKLLSPKESLELDIIRDRVKRYPHAKTPEEIYPPHDSLKGPRDISSIYYHMATDKPVSPICIARVTLKNGTVRMVLLDGRHRRIAALFRGSMVKVLFIDL